MNFKGTAIKNRESKKLANNTYLIRKGDNFAIRLHNTDVVTITPENTFILNSGGWQTKTTKERINEFTNARIAQKGGLWYMRDGSLFYDGIIVNQSGDVVSEIKPVTDTKTLKAKVDRMIKTYIDGFIQDIKDNGLSDPSSGDCWCCCMFKDSKDVGHIISHFEEKYYVPSLLWQAVQRRGNPALCWQMFKSNPDMFRDDLRYYFKALKPAIMEATK